MQHIVRALGCFALVSSLAACVVSPSQQLAEPSRAPNPHEMAVHRLEQVDGRIDNMGRSIDARVNQGHFPPPDGAALRVARYPLIGFEMANLGMRAIELA